MNVEATLFCPARPDDQSMTVRRGCSVFAILFVGFGTPGIAQERVPPIVAASFDLLPYSGLENPQGAAEQELEVQLNNPRLEANLPIRLGEGAALVPGIVYSFLDFGYRNTTAVPAGAPDKLHDLSVRLTMTAPLGDTWRVVASAQPGLASDFENIESDHWRFQGALVLSRGIGSGGTLGVGGAYRYDFGKGLVLPVLNLQYETDRFRFDLQPPRSAGAYLLAGTRVEVGLFGRVDGSQYRLGGAPAQGHQVRYSVVSAGPAVNIRLGSVVTARLTGGIVTARRFEIQDSTAAELRGIDLESGYFARIGLEFRPPSTN